MKGKKIDTKAYEQNRPVNGGFKKYVCVDNKSEKKTFLGGKKLKKILF